MPKTYNDLYLETRKLLRDNGIAGYNLEARIIVSQAAGKNMDKFLQGLSLYTSDGMQHKVRELCERRLLGEPVAYLTGRWEFYGIPIEVTRDVLIPRMDTELLVERALDLFTGRKMNARVLDICAGSGCIGCAIGVKLPGAKIVLSDKSPAALALCRKNVSLNNIEQRVTFLEADVFEAPPMLMGSFDLVVCNPPYIPTEDIKKLDPSVRDYEPHMALDGGADGLDFYRAIIKNWKTVVRENGIILFEVGINQAQSVMKLLRLAGFRHVESYKDTADIDRVVGAKL